MTLVMNIDKNKTNASNRLSVKVNQPRLAHPVDLQNHTKAKYQGSNHRDKDAA